MLREIKDGAFVRDGLTLLGRRWRLRAGASGGPSWSTRRVRAIEAAQLQRPLALVRDGGRCTWLFEGRFYWEDAELGEDDVLALIRERERRTRRRLQRAHAALAQDGAARRERIPVEVRRAVFERDGGCCVQCGSAFDIQYDHVIPFSIGGASTADNLQILCSACNQVKGASLS